MKKIIFLVILALVIIGGISVADFFGYYFEFKKPLYMLAIGAPILQFLMQVFQRPEKNISPTDVQHQQNNNVQQQLNQMHNEIEKIKINKK